MILKVSLLYPIISLLACISFGHGNTHSSANDDDDYKHLNTIYSLPDLLANNKLANNKDKGLPNYEFQNTELLDGRIVLNYNELGGGMLSKSGKHFKQSDSFAIEYTIRNLANLADKPKDNSLFDSNDNFAFFLADDLNKIDDLIINESNINKLAFNGILLYLDAKDKYGGELKFIMNDGASKYSTMNDLYQNSIGSCLINYYEDSSIPITIRLNYDASQHLLSVQVDNKICLQTRSVNLNSFDNGKIYKIATTSSGLTKSNSKFEVLKLNFFDSLIQDSYLPNIKSMPQPKILNKIVNKDTGDVVYQEIDKLSDSDINLLKLYKKLNTIEGKVIANDNVDLFKKVERLEDLSIKQFKQIEKLLSVIEVLASSSTEGSNILDNSEFKDIVGVNEKLEKLLVEQQEWKSSHQYNSKSNSNSDSKVHVDEIIFKLLLWLSPLGVIMLVMVYFTFSIKREIGKQKLL